MTEKISNLPRQSRKMTPEGRAAQSASGRRNIEAWLAKQDVAGEAIRTEVARFREQLLTELGERPTCTRRALAETAVSNYNSILLINNELSRKRLKDRMAVAERVSWLTGNVVRLLKLLNLDAKPKAPFVPWGPSSKVSTGILELARRGREIERKQARNRY